MAKLDKSQYTKEEWRKLKAERKAQKSAIVTHEESLGTLTSFVLGNGISRKQIDPNYLKPYGKIYGCNALYREFDPDYLIAVDVKMILEINRAGYQHKHEVWTNPNKAYQKFENLKLFQPSKGWSSGPTALWLASQHQAQRIFILGFDYTGTEGGKLVNNLYAGTPNYKKPTDGATYYGNWLKQTASVIRDNPHITYYRVIQPDNFLPSELNNFNNLKTVYVEDFMKMFNVL